MNPPKALSFLVVEDEPMTSKMLAHHLEKFGRVITTRNAREAIANHTVQNPDIIFLDIHYRDDEYDGFDVLSHILGVTPQAFVVMFSSDSDEKTVEKALERGAKGFIAKPFHADKFAHYLASFSVRE